MRPFPKGMWLLILLFGLNHVGHIYFPYRHRRTVHFARTNKVKLENQVSYPKQKPSFCLNDRSLPLQASIGSSA